MIRKRIVDPVAFMSWGIKLKTSMKTIGRMQYSDGPYDSTFLREKKETAPMPFIALQ